MPSFISGYEYDIFISYRQKDNKHDGWVTDFVEHLKGELESTFKEDISVYFDENPHDGLLETYVVDDSLKEKLKCLVFIPILSRTYCDKRSFAWVNEFEAFIKIASDDSFGLKVRLPNGNVASRVLPVRIYDLDASDSRLFESVIGGTIRSIDFIYASTGVNRPLLPKEEKPYENLNHTNYRDQINKVGNALKEIISAMVFSGKKTESTYTPSPSSPPDQIGKKNKLIVSGLIILLIIIFLGIFVLPKLVRNKKVFEKSIAVLPFIYDSHGDTNQYFMDGLMEDVLIHLQSIKDLTPRSRISAEKFRNTSKTIPEIAKELGVNYVVEGVGRRSGNLIKLNINLYKIVKKEVRIWGHSYDQEIHDARDVFRIESQLAEDIAEELNAVITPQEKQRIEKAPTANLAAYEDYLLGKSYLNRFFHQDFDVAMQHFEHAKYKDSAYTLAYVGISEVWLMRAISSYSSPLEATPKALAAFNKAYQLDSTLAEVYICRSRIQNYLMFDCRGAEISCEKALSLSPNNAYVRTGYANLLVILGRPKEAVEQIEIALRLDPMNLDTKGPYGVILFCSKRYDDAIRAFKELLEIDPKNGTALDNLPLVLHTEGRYTEALKVWETLFSIYFKGYANIFKQNDTLKSYKEVLNLQGDSLTGNLKTRYINPTEIAQIYACAGNRGKTLEMLEAALKEHDPNLPYVLRFPIFDFLKDEVRFLNLCNMLNLPIKLQEI
jgi:TolB-like protein